MSQHGGGLSLETKLESFTRSLLCFLVHIPSFVRPLLSEHNFYFRQNKFHF